MVRELYPYNLAGEVSQQADVQANQFHRACTGLGLPAEFMGWETGGQA